MVSTWKRFLLLDHNFKMLFFLDSQLENSHSTERPLTTGAGIPSASTGSWLLSSWNWLFPSGMIDGGKWWCMVGGGDGLYPWERKGWAGLLGHSLEQCVLTAAYLFANSLSYLRKYWFDNLWSKIVSLTSLGDILCIIDSSFSDKNATFEPLFHFSFSCRNSPTRVDKIASQNGDEDQTNVSTNNGVQATTGAVRAPLVAVYRPR